MTTSLPARSAIPPDQTWNTADVYPSDAAWEDDARHTYEQLPRLARLVAEADQSASALLAALQARDQWLALAWRIRWYGAMQVKVDAGDDNAAGLLQRAHDLLARMEEAFAALSPSLVALTPERFAAFVQEQPALGVYEHAIDAVRRRHAHIRSAEVEDVLAATGALAATPREIYNALVNDEIAFGVVRAEDGAAIAVSQATFTELIRSPHRPTRQAAWERYSEGYVSHQKALAGTLAGSVRRDILLARAHRYPSALDAALDQSWLPRSVYANLLGAFRAHLPLWPRYWEVRRRALGVERLHGYDLDVPLIRAQRRIPYDDARTLLLAAMAPMGDDYVSTLRRGLYDERWVDWAANRGKTGGAEQSGAYGLHPFVLLTYPENLLGVSVLAHEMGHAMHTHYTCAHQPQVYEDTANYLAETASTLSQALLRAHVLHAERDPDMRLEVLADALAYFYRYLFQMPLLAQFEMESHERVERGESLTAGWMSARMLDLLGEGYGPAVTLDPARDGVIWAQFSHLFLNFYAYQYALGLASATTLAGMIEREGAPAAARVLDCFKAGDSVYPLDALRLAGIDLTTPEPIDRAFETLAALVDELETLVGSGPLA